jgi:hypothetical protein
VSLPPGAAICPLTSWQHAASFCSAADTFWTCLRAPHFTLQLALLWGMRMKMPKAWRRLGPPPCLRTSSGPDLVSCHAV